MKNKQKSSCSYSHVIDFLSSNAWAMRQSHLDLMTDILDRRMHGDFDLTQIKADLGTDFGNSYEVRKRGGAALIPINGTISRKMNLFSQISGGTSIDFLQRDISAALKDDSIDEVHLIVDSPGGTVNGTKELADFIYASRGKKPIIAFIEGEGMSAAYWIASAADEVVGFPTSMVGSIGVILQHTDVSERNKAEGIKKKAIFAGKYKTAGTPHEPLSAESEAYLQDMVDKMYVSFIEGVAQNRGVEVSVVLEKMADARIFVAQDALDAGLIDRIGTWEEFFTSSNGNATGFDASADTSGLGAHSKADDQNLMPDAAFTHNNTETEGEPAWSVVDKTKLPRNAHAETGKPDQKATWKYPHHWIKGGEEVDANGIYTGGDMYLHKAGLSFAWGAANGARSGKEASASVKSHLKTHRSAAGMSASWDSDAWKLEVEGIFGDDFKTVFEGWSFLTENKTTKEECNMDMNKFKAEHPALHKDVCAEAREGYITVEASTALHSDLVTQAAADKGTIEGLKAQVAEKDKTILTGAVAKNKAVADGIMSTILAESVVPEKLHGRVSLDFQGFVKDGEPFTAESGSGKAFATAFTAEVGSWETEMGLEASGSKGAGEGKSNSSTTDIDAEADIELGREMARKTGAIRSDAKA